MTIFEKLCAWPYATKHLGNNQKRSVDVGHGASKKHKSVSAFASRHIGEFDLFIRHMSQEEA